MALSLEWTSWALGLWVAGLAGATLLVTGRLPLKGVLSLAPFSASCSSRRAALPRHVLPTHYGGQKQWSQGNTE
jgi:hypothetical protein